MSKEIIKEDDISEFEVISAKEDEEGYRMKNPLFVQDAMDFGFVDRMYLSTNCEEILNDTL